MPSHPRPPRSRWALAACITTVIAAGLASRAVPGPLPAAWAGYPGDALWAMMVFFGIAFIRPRIAPLHLAGLALAVSYAVECAQLYQGAWAQAVRSTRLGHLALGAGFDWIDLVAYTVGVVAGFLLDRLLFARVSPTSP